MRCRGCKYVLDGLTTSRCPECGREFDVADPKSFLPGDAPTADPQPEQACVRCGYDLAGVANDACPECGQQFTPRPSKPGTMPRTSSQLGGMLRRLGRRGRNR